MEKNTFEPLTTQHQSELRNQPFSLSLYIFFIFLYIVISVVTVRMRIRSSCWYLLLLVDIFVTQFLKQAPKSTAGISSA